ncbi:MAG: archaetidylserine synthase [Methanosarcinaceae archaeon]|nr:archaetidylserine synthase [Methanosarcinaceae archaeon]
MQTTKGSEMIFIYLKLADVVTLFNSLCGLLAVIIVQDGFTYLAPVLILAAAVADGIDGYLSRLFSGSEIGANLDSLADAISFGLAPVAIMYSFVNGKANYVFFAALCFYFCCGILRLARFNTSDQELPYFRGLPITAGGIILSAYILAGEDHFYVSIATLLAVAIGILMVSRITYMKARKTGILTPIALIFGITILSYALNVNYTHSMAGVLLGVMVLYVISPAIKRTV